MARLRDFGRASSRVPSPIRCSSDRPSNIAANLTTVTRESCLSRLIRHGGAARAARHRNGRVLHDSAAANAVRPTDLDTQGAQDPSTVGAVNARW